VAGLWVVMPADPLRFLLKSRPKRTERPVNPAQMKNPNATKAWNAPHQLLLLQPLGVPRYTAAAMDPANQKIVVTTASPSTTRMWYSLGKNLGARTRYASTRSDQTELNTIKLTSLAAWPEK